MATATDPLAPRPHMDFGKGIRGKHFDAASIAPSFTPYHPQSKLVERAAHMMQSGGDRPTPTQIDEIVDHFHNIRDEWELADERYEECKDSVIALVQRFGIVPAGAEQSLRLEGRVNILTVTTGNTSTVKEEAVVDLKSAMRVHKKLPLFEMMFAERTKYELRKDASVHLRTATLSKRLVKLFTDLYARCTDVKKKSPSLKIERIDAAKPKKAARKAAIK